MYTKNSGFTLTEMIVGSAVFAIIALSVFQTYFEFINLVSIGKYKIMAADIINEQMELIRNLSYTDVGVKNSIPNGALDQVVFITRNGSTFEVTRTIRNIDDPFDGTLSGTPNDLSPSDSKLVQIDIECSFCKNFTPVSATTRIAPKNLETASNNGALFIKAFDANGVPVPQANVSVQYIGTTTTITINDVTNNQGVFQIVDAPPGVKSYRISVNKDNYTIDRTYATSSNNPNPVNPDATVLNQQVTQSSFIIDRVSQAKIITLNTACETIPNVSFTITGGKLIGIPNVLKFDKSYSTDSNGEKILSDLEWDSFDITANGSGLYLAGTNPSLPISILPNSSQTISLIMSSDAPSHFLTTVTDSGTNLPISGATLTLTNTVGFTRSLESGRGYLEQTNWVGGAGQNTVGDLTKFSTTDGNIEINNPAGNTTLKSSLGLYAPTGEIVSSIFDTGTSSNFGNIFWSPSSQPIQTGNTPLQFQIASAPDNTATTTWNFKGPDGTNASYYTVSNTNIDSSHNGDRYIRYKMILSTNDSNFTPTLANVAFTFTSGCIPPGQAIFSGLSNGNYTLTITKAGYNTISTPISINSSWSKQNFSLLPQ